MTEHEFITSIDCRFPYADPPRASALIRQSLAVSANATFAIVDEIARAPRSTRVTLKTRLRLLAEVDAALTHPLKDLILDIARRQIHGQTLPGPEAVRAMCHVAQFPGQYAALGIVYFTTDPDDDSMETLFDEIVRSWGST
jgi:hypothetical protein